MDEDIIGYIAVAIIVLLCILAFIIPIVLCVEHNKDREFELEKYKIEMQVKHGDVVEVE